MPSLAILAASVFEYRVEKRQTDRQTNAGENLTPRLPLEWITIIFYLYSLFQEIYNNDDAPYTKSRLIGVQVVQLKTDRQTYASHRSTHHADVMFIR